MKNLILSVAGWALIFYAQAQRADALENKPMLLRERYYLMKTQAETYQDYKVIKEYIIDGVWKIQLDSMNGYKKLASGKQLQIDSLHSELSKVQTAFNAQLASMADVTFSSSHINAFGKDFPKTAFVIMVTLITIFLLFGVALLVIRMNEMEKFVKESKLIVNSVNNEFDEYKHKAVEKQIKLARELQTERNKLSDLKLQTQKNH